MVDRLKRFLAEHGCNIDEIAQLRNSDPILSSSAFGPINLSTVDSFKVETLYCKLSKVNYLLLCYLYMLFLNSTYITLYA